MSKKAQTITDERPLEAKIMQKSHRSLSTSERWQNANSEITRLEQEKESKAPFITDRTMQIALAQGKHKEAKESYDQAVQTEKESLARIERQEAMAKIGGPSEEVILQALLKNHETVVKDVEFAKSNLDEAILLKDQIPAIVESLEQITAECDQLDHEKNQMESIRDELFQALGREQAESIATEIIATRDAFEEHQRQAPILEAAHSNAVYKIKSLREDYPDLYQQLLSSHGHALQDAPKTEAEYVLEGYRTFIVALIEHGAKASTRVLNEQIRLIDFLVVDAPTILDYARTGSGFVPKRRAFDAWGREIEVPAHQKLDVIEKILKEQKRHRGSSSY